MFIFSVSSRIFEYNIKYKTTNYPDIREKLKQYTVYFQVHCTIVSNYPDIREKLKQYTVYFQFHFTIVSNCVPCICFCNYQWHSNEDAVSQDADVTAIIDIKAKRARTLT